MDQQNMLTIDDVEREFALKRSTLYNCVRRGLIKPYKIVGDRRSYFKQSEIENLIQFQPRETAVLRRKTLSSTNDNGGSKREVT